jgi:hypothetical protein
MVSLSGPLERIVRLRHEIDSSMGASYNAFNLRVACQIGPMRPLSKDHLTNRLRQFCNGFRHAFSTQPATSALNGEDAEFLDRIADALVTRGMGAPATMFLESMGPMNFLGSQALHVLTPIIECAFDGKELERVARLLERRETMSRLIALIETKTSMQRASAQ